MAMAKFTVDGPNSLLIAKAGVTDVDVQIDLYSDAKEHWLTTSDNKYFFPFRTIAGDVVSATKNFADGYFLQNGWKIRPDEADHVLTLDQNLFVGVEEVDQRITVPTLGAFTVEVRIFQSADGRNLNQADITLTRKIFQNRRETDPVAGTYTVYDDDDVTVLLSGNIWEDIAMAQPYRGLGLDRQDRLVAP